MHRISINVALFACFLLASISSAQDVGPSYEVDLSDALNHYVTVTMVADATGDETEIMMATWTPGSYLVREYAKHIDRIEATTARGRGKQLEIEKTSKNRWIIDTSNTKRFKVKYRIYCNEQSVRTNFVGQSYGVLNGAPTFVTVPSQLDRPHSITLKLPENWKRSATSLRAEGDEPHQYVANDYDDLVDSPIVAGNVSLYPFQVAGIEHTLVNVNEAGYWDGEKAARDLAKIVKAHHDLWETVPYDRYMFINVIGGGGGGLEHDNCCLMMTSRWGFRSDSAYKRWLSLASHEFFHTWNIRRLRPKALVNYDYENEVYTPSLWIAEGITSYYEDLLLVRAGLMSQDEFLAGMGSAVTRVQRSKGSRVQSLRDSSHDAWIKFYRPEANSGDTTVSYYTKGSVVAFLLDAQIRSQSNGEKSLDDVLRTMYQEYANGVGYLPSDFRRVCSEAAGSDLSKWFASAVDSPDELEWQELCNWFGFQVGDVKPLKPGETAKEARARKPSRARWIGIGESGSPASKAGLSDTDEILGVNGLRLTGGISTRIQQFEVGDAITLLISRDDKIMEVAVTIGSRTPTPDWRMSLYRRATDEQERNLAKWLYQPYDEPEEKVSEEKPTKKADQPPQLDSLPATTKSDSKKAADQPPRLDRSESGPANKSEDNPLRSAPKDQKLEVTIKGDSSAKIGENITTQIVISNRTDSELRQVKLTNEFSSVTPQSASAKFGHDWDGEDFVINVGSIPAQESATVEIVFAADEKSRKGWVSFQVSAEGQKSVTKRLDLQINEPKQS